MRTTFLTQVHHGTIQRRARQRCFPHKGGSSRGVLSVWKKNLPSTLESQLRQRGSLVRHGRLLAKTQNTHPPLVHKITPSEVSGGKNERLLARPTLVQNVQAEPRIRERYPRKGKRTTRRTEPGSTRFEEVLVVFTGILRALSVRNRFDLFFLDFSMLPDPN